MRILVCGGRNFSNRDLVFRELNRLRKTAVIDAVIEGNASGIDRIAGYWARKHRIKNIKFPADWKTYGRSAGPRRNEKMLLEGKPDLVVAFPGGKGTVDMVRRAQSANVPVTFVDCWLETTTDQPRRTDVRPAEMRELPLLDALAPGAAE